MLTVIAPATIAPATIAGKEFQAYGINEDQGGGSTKGRKEAQIANEQRKPTVGESFGFSVDIAIFIARPPGKT